MSAVTQAEFADIKGVTRSAINQAIKTNKIQLNDDGLIETEKTDYNPGNSNGQLAKAKAVRESYLAKKAKLDYEKSVELVLDAEEVSRAMEQLGEMIARDLDQLQAFTDEIVSISAKDGAKGVRKKLREISRRMRQTMADNLTLDNAD